MEVALIDFAMALHDTDLSAVMGARGKQGSGFRRLLGLRVYWYRLWLLGTVRVYGFGVWGKVLAAKQLWAGQGRWAGQRSATEPCRARAGRSA